MFTDCCGLCVSHLDNIITCASVFQITVYWVLCHLISKICPTVADTKTTRMFLACLEMKVFLSIGEIKTYSCQELLGDAWNNQPYYNYIPCQPFTIVQAQQGLSLMDISHKSRSGSLSILSLFLYSWLCETSCEWDIEYVCESNKFQCCTTKRWNIDYLKEKFGQI